MKYFPVVAFLPSVTLGESDCGAGLDIMFLQDTTYSFDEDLENVARQIPDFFKKISSKYPDTYFGVAEFRDKPYLPAGEETDFCYKLGDGKLSPALGDLEWAYSLLVADGGGDPNEATFQALVNVALDQYVGWRPLKAPGETSKRGQAAAHIVVLSTDALPHVPGDIHKYNRTEWPLLPAELPKNNGGITDPDDLLVDCVEFDYPSPQQVSQALEHQNITLITLTPSENHHLTKAWHWFNEKQLGQPDNFYQYIENDSSNLGEVLVDAVDSVAKSVCLP